MNDDTRLAEDAGLVSFCTGWRRVVEQGEWSMRPGFPIRESHAHLAMHGRALSLPRLDDVRDVAGALEVVREASAALGPGEWVMVCGARVEGWRETRWPTVEELERACGGRPCCLMSFDHHAVMASRAALAAAGIGAGSADPAGGVIVRDRDGEATGLLLESVAWRVWGSAPEASVGAREAHVRCALADLRRVGYVEVHDLKAPLWLGEVLGRLHDAGELPMRVEVYVMLEEVEGAARARGWERPGLRLAGAKVFADGTLNSRTAWMLEPYQEPIAGHECGKALMTVGELVSAMRRAHGVGLGLAVHAIGDAAVRAVLDAREAFLKEIGEDGRSGRSPGLRIEHAEVIDEADVVRFARLGVVASVQPCHLLADVEVLMRQLPGRLERVMPLRELLASGLEPGRGVVFGSDVPIVRADPEDSIRAAVERGRGGLGESRIAPGQAISEALAWACFGAEERGC